MCIRDRNSTDVDRKVDKYSWWTTAITTSTKLRRKGNDPGPIHLWSTTGGNLVSYNTTSYCYRIIVYCCLAVGCWDIKD